MTHEEALRKAMACLRLAKSGNENEAALAAAKAQEIIDRYKLDVTGLDYDQQEQKRDDEPIQDYGHSDQLDETNGWMTRWYLMLASVVARSNQCRVYYGQKQGYGVRIFIVGRPSDVSAVRYLHSLLKSEVTRLASDACKGHSDTYRRQYCLGVVDTINARLHKQHEEMAQSLRREHANNNMALIRVDKALVRMQERDEAVVTWMKSNLRLGNGRSEQTRTYTGGREHGQRDGHKVRISSAKGGIGAGVRQLN